MLFDNKIIKKGKIYKRIFAPYYNADYIIDTTNMPNLYNIDGKKMDIFFIRDEICCHNPYGQNSKYFLWDRFNIGLKIHFYSHKSMLETMGFPDKRFGILYESKSIVSKDYDIFRNNKGLEKDFDNILTYDEELLSSVSNSLFFPFSVAISVKILSNDMCLNKKINLSIVCSNKKFTKHHKIRHQCAHILKKNMLGDVYGGFDGSKWLENKSDSLKDYRYQVVVENGVFDYYFTEKIMDCFVSMTIPVYLGARKIGDFFNLDGIILISEKDIDNLPKILQQCNKIDYESRLTAIKDNYERALQYQNLDDKLYETLFLEDDHKK